MTNKRPVAVVGAGLVGSGWALVFARAGYSVQAYDPSPEVRDRILPWARQSIGELEAVGLVGDQEMVLSRITVHDTLVKALAGAFYIQESVYETIPAKTEVSMAIDSVMDKDAVVGSSSSGIPASKFTESYSNRARFLIAHPVNPPHLVPVVEIVPAPWTAPEAVEMVSELMRAIDQVPVRLTREIDGFVLNRLQGVLLNEAWALYQDGIASLADIDATIAHGLGLRWSFMGPFETIDLNAPGGVADYVERFGPLLGGITQEQTPYDYDTTTVDRVAEARRAALPLDRIEERSAWRDRRLMALVAHKRGQAEIPESG